MAWIGAHGSVLKPENMIPRKTVDADLLLTEVTTGKGSMRSEPHGFLTWSFATPGLN
jgi:hypothetical protein